MSVSENIACALKALGARGFSTHDMSLADVLAAYLRSVAPRFSSCPASASSSDLIVRLGAMGAA